MEYKFDVSRNKRMKTLIISLLISAAISSCNLGKNEQHDAEVIFFLQTENPELISDYDYYLDGLIKYYSDKNIKITQTKDRKIKIGINEISIDDNESFAIIMIDKDGDYDIDYTFGTDVDMMMIINKFYENN